MRLIDADALAERKYPTLTDDDPARAYQVGWNDAMDEVMQYEPTVSGWIPVKERLPENRDWVLGIFQEGDTGWINPIPFICDYVGKKTPITTQDNWLLKMVDEPHPYYERLHCIAWMPLPKAWKERSMEREGEG